MREYTFSQMMLKATLGGLAFVFGDFLAHTYLLERVFTQYYPETIIYYLQKIVVFVIAYYLVYMVRWWYTTLSRRLGFLTDDVAGRHLGFALTAAFGMSLAYGAQNIYGGYPSLGLGLSTAVYLVHFAIALAAINIIEP